VTSEIGNRSESRGLKDENEIRQTISPFVPIKPIWRSEFVTEASYLLATVNYMMCQYNYIEIVSISIHVLQESCSPGHDQSIHEKVLR
jgi:hypothetical protein